MKSPHLEEENTMRTHTLNVKRECIVVIITKTTINPHLGVTIGLEKIVIPRNLELTFLPFMKRITLNNI